ncbi:MAG: protein translocase subunit SecD, partial [Bryobacteraceae bacterium]
MKSLKWKAALIVAITLASLYGVFGLPRSKEELVANWKKNIRLGLDLRGGSMLVVQVQLQDAFKVEANTQIERLKEELAKQSIPYQSIAHNDPQTLADADKIAIEVRGIPAEKSQLFRNIVAELLPSWVLTPLSSTDYRLTMKPTEALALKEDTVKR